MILKSLGAMAQNMILIIALMVTVGNQEGLYVTENLRKEHFNLYYIFKEDKEQNVLSLNEVNDIWYSIVKKFREIKKQSAKK